MTTTATYALVDPGTPLTVNTELTSVSTAFTYETYYVESGLEDLLYVFIADSVFTEGGIGFIEGEGGARYTSNITCRNENGELVIDGENASQYSLNSNGDLIYTY